MMENGVLTIRAIGNALQRGLSNRPALQEL